MGSRRDKPDRQQSVPLADVRGDAEQMAAILAALANPTRLQVITHLLDQEISVNELAKSLAISASALSQHLSKLRAQNLVETRRESQTIFYSCRSKHIRRLLEELQCLADLQASRRVMSSQIT